jgi:DNA-binding PadR family transcriptional regulator
MAVSAESPTLRPGGQVSAQFTILRCLINEPAHGYQLQQVLATLTQTYPLRNVNVYPLLRDLEQTGKVRVTTELIDSRARRVYTITDRGVEAFEEWVGSHPEMPLPEVRDPVYHRLALMTESSRDLAWLEESIAAVTAEAERAMASYDRGRASMAPVARLVAEELIDHLHRRRTFLERVLVLVESDGSEDSSRA